MKRIFALSDLHGRYNLWLKVKDYIYPEDTLVFLGDAIDRGPDGIKIVEELRNRPNTIYLRGNHEDVAAAAIRDMLDDEWTLYNNGYSPIDLWAMNGGMATEIALEDKTKAYKRELSNYFSKLPIQYVYINQNKQTIICDHSGYTPNISYKPMWDRRHFFDSWPNDYDTTYIVHGHTPAEYLGTHFPAKDYEKTNDTKDVKVVRYCSGHKFDIDMGSAWNNITVLLNLDTFEEVYFNGS